CGGYENGPTASQDSPSTGEAIGLRSICGFVRWQARPPPTNAPTERTVGGLAHRSQNGPFSPRAAKWATSSSFDGRTYSSFRRSRYRGTLSACVCPIVRAAPSGPGFASRQSSMWDVPRKKTMWFEHVFRMSFHHCAAGRDRYTRVSRGEAVARPFARVIAIDSAQWWHCDPIRISTFMMAWNATASQAQFAKYHRRFRSVTMNGV